MSRRLTMEDENKPFIPPAAVVQILTRQDIPQDYKEYVKSYFDVIQKEGQDHGEE